LTQINIFHPNPQSRKIIISQSHPTGSFTPLPEKNMPPSWKYINRFQVKKNRFAPNLVYIHAFTIQEPMPEILVLSKIQDGGIRHLVLGFWPYRGRQRRYLRQI